MREQALEHRLVYEVGVGAGVAGTHLEVFGGLPQLRMHVVPFADAHVVQVFAFAHLAELAVRQRFAFFAQIGPQRQEGEEVRVGLDETFVRQVGGLLVVQGAFARVLDRHGRHDDEDIGEATETVGGQQHSPKPRVDRQPRQRTAEFGQVVAAQGTEFAQQVGAVGDRA